MAWTKSTSFGTDDKNQMLSRVRNPGWLKSRSAESTSAVNRPSWRKWSTVLHSVKKNYRYFTEFLDIIDMCHLSSSVITYHRQEGDVFKSVTSHGKVWPVSPIVTWSYKYKKCHIFFIVPKSKFLAFWYSMNDVTIFLRLFKSFLCPAVWRHLWITLSSNEQWNQWEGFYHGVISYRVFPGTNFKARTMNFPFGLSPTLFSVQESEAAAELSELPKEV